MEEKLKRFEHLWKKDKHKYLLIKLKIKNIEAQYGIFNYVDKAILTIEDMDVYRLVVDRMLLAGVKVKDAGELKDYIKNSK